MKSKKSAAPNSKPKKPSKPLPNFKEPDQSNSTKLTLFDHVKHIRGVQSPDYYTTLSEENQKTFNHFMILRALAMDNEIVQEMAFLYRYHHLIPSPQFYKVLIALVPFGNRWVPWIKTKIVRHSPELLTAVSKHYSISKRQANEYVNVLLASDQGRDDLNDLCRSMGMSDGEIEEYVPAKEEE